MLRVKCAMRVMNCGQFESMCAHETDDRWSEADALVQREDE
jgi:hypothetical protein